MSDEQKKPVLAACLHCGGDDLFISKHYGPLYVFCDKCNAEGPKETTKAEAITAWNRRHLCDDHAFCCNTCDHKCGIELVESDGEE